MPLRYPGGTQTLKNTGKGHSTGADAISKIEALSPDLVFLDVQMPEINGFEVVDAVGPESMPLVIFATAYDRYALQAFDAHAFDYLLKPFDEERFRHALDRARKELERPQSVSDVPLRSLLESLRKPPYLTRLAVRSCGRVIFIKAKEIDWVEASGNYVTLHVGRESYLVRTTMNALEHTSFSWFSWVARSVSPTASAS